MKPDEAKSTFLLEHCAERCGGVDSGMCGDCEINAAIEALDKQIARSLSVINIAFHISDVLFVAVRLKHTKKIAEIECAVGADNS